jgi:hypothetical protein
MGAKTMVRSKAAAKPTVASEQRRLMWGIPGGREADSLARWDPKQQPLIEALLAIVSSGASVFLRPGSGGRSVGIAIWEGDVRHAPTWCYDTEELDEWAESILKVAKRDMSPEE